MAANEDLPSGVTQEAGEESPTTPPTPETTEVSSAPENEEELSPTEETAQEEQVTLSTPSPGEQVQIAIVPGLKIYADFDLQSQELTATDADLIIEFDNGAVITLTNFALYAAGDTPPMMVLSDGSLISGDTLVFSYTGTEIEPAAGPALASGGSGEYRDDLGDLIGGLDRLGTQNPDPFGGALEAPAEDEELNVPPDAVDDLATTDEETPVTIAVLPNDSDPDGDPLTITDFTQTTNGTLVSNGDGTFTYTPNENFNGTDSFEYTITDGNGNFDTATVTINVGPINDGPIARDNANSVIEAMDDPSLDEADKPIATGNVLTDNDGDGVDSDTDSDPAGFAVTAIEGGTVGTGFSTTYGTLLVNSDGSYTYTLDNTDLDVQALNDADTLVETFDYTMTDGDGKFSTATLTITINGANDSPIATDNANFVIEAMDDPALDEADKPVASGNVLTNDDGDGVDSDIDSDPAGFAVTAIEGGTVGTGFGTLYGTLLVNSDGSYTYTLNNTDLDVQALNDADTLVETFDYTMTDGDGKFSTATLTITINGANDSPIATNNANFVIEAMDDPALDEVDKPIATGNVLTDNDGDGVDSDVDSDPAGFAVTAIEGGTVGTGFGTPYGTLLVNSDGSYTYTLDNTDPDVQALNDTDDDTANDTLVETFDYTMTDGDGKFSTATLTITINGANDSPIATNNANSVTEDGPLVALGNLILDDDGFGVDSDVDNVVNDGSTDDLDVVQLENFEGTPSTDGTIIGQYGTLTWVVETGAYEYNLDNANETVQGLGSGDPPLTDTFTYTLSDGDKTDTATLTITINGANDPPDGVDDPNILNTIRLVATNNTGTTTLFRTLIDPDAPADPPPNPYEAIAPLTFEGGNFKVDELVYDSEGTLWAIQNGSPRNVYTIDPLTGIATLQFVLAISGDADGFAFGTFSNGNGSFENMYVLSGNDLFVVDPSSGNVTSSHPDLLNSSNELADLVLLNGRLYTASSNGELFEINLNPDGTIDSVDTLINSVGGGDVPLNSIYGMVAGGDGRLYLVNSTGNNGEVLVLDIDSEANTFTEFDSFDITNPQGGGNLDALAGQVNPETSIAGNVLFNDTDPDDQDFGDPPGSSTSLTVTEVNGQPLDGPIDGLFGTLTISADGAYTYTLTDEETPGFDAFEYTVQDPGGATDTAVLHFSVNNNEGEVVGNSDTTLAVLEATNGTNDLLIGGDGDNELIGKEGDDFLIGGMGSDTFTFSALGGEGNDYILDFDVAEGDILNFTDVLDEEPPIGTLDLDDLAPFVTAVEDLGDDVKLTVEDTGTPTTITLAGVGTLGDGTINTLTELNSIINIQAEGEEL